MESDKSGRHILEIRKCIPNEHLTRRNRSIPVFGPIKAVILRMWKAFNIHFTSAMSSISQSPPAAFNHSITVLALASLVSVTVYIVSRLLYRRSLVDAKGNSIPDGPMGLPIVGEP